MATSSSQAHTDQAAQQHIPHENIQHDGDLVLRMLVLLQRQQLDQLRILRQLLQEVETLKQAQNQQGSTVEKLDRRLKRARLLHASWLFIRWALFIAVTGAIIYLIGPEQILAVWQRIVWLLT